MPNFARMISYLHRSTRRNVFWIGLMLSVVLPSKAQSSGMAEMSVPDTTLVSVDTVVKKRNLVNKILDYFRQHDEDKDKKFSFGVLPGPHYSSTVGFGLGVVATGLYSMDHADTLLPKSNVALYGDVTTKGFLMMGVRGNNIFPKERFRLDYRLYVYTFPTEFYGIGYEQGDDDANQADFRRFKFDWMGRFMFRMARNLYIGPTLNFQFIRATEMDPLGEQFIAGQRHTVHALTPGVSFTYDSRDFILNAKRGWFVQLDQTFTPKWLGNTYGFSTTDFTTSTYAPLWKGCTFAAELHSRFNYGDVPWCMMAEMGGTNRMRGYYEGRYRDRNIIEGQVELRQHIKGRHGAVAWVGTAQVFPEASALRWTRFLPNFGIGYRWAFRPGINIRLDYGFTRNGGGFLFNINEAF